MNKKQEKIKDKAFELFYKFHDELCKLNGSFSGITRQSKGCALILVDEIMNGNFADGYDHSFWQEVKSEIEKI